MAFVTVFCEERIAFLAIDSLEKFIVQGRQNELDCSLLLSIPSNLDWSQ